MNTQNLDARGITAGPCAAPTGSMGNTLARFHQISVASLASLAVSGLLLAATACGTRAPDSDGIDGLRSDNEAFEEVQVTLEDVAALEPGELLVLNLDFDVVYEVKGEVWSEAGDRISVIGQGAEMKVEQWVAEVQGMVGELDTSQSMRFAGDASSFDLSDAQLSTLEEQGDLVMDIDLVLCLDCGYVHSVFAAE